MQYEKLETPEILSSVSGKPIVIQHARYTWLDEEYKEYMREILMIMEPRCEMAGTTIINEMDEFLEVTFFIHGSYKIGYSLNNKRIYVLPFSCVRRGNAIGAYGCTFNKRAVIIYTTVKQCRGHFIRKSAWHGLLNKLDPALCKSIRKGLADDYLTNTKSKIVAHKA